jgi:hypothetical protein
MLALLLACGFLACSGKDDDSTPADDSGGGDDSGEDILYPDGDRILMYYGNGGFQTDIAGSGKFEDIGELWKDQFGWNSDPSGVWPDAMEPYRMIGLVAPGWSGPVPFDSASVELLQAALDRGTRIVVFGEQAMCESGAKNVNALVGALGATWTMRGEGANQFAIVDTNAVSTGKQMTQGVSQIRMIDPCWIDRGNADILVADDNNNFVAVAERPGKAGDVVFVGDITMWDDTEDSDGDHGFEKADNRTFLMNMVRITWK